MGGRRLPLLATNDYNPCTFSMTQPDVMQDGKIIPGRSSWVEIFRIAIDSFVKNAHTDDSVPEHERLQRAQIFRSTFSSYLTSVADNPEKFPGITTLDLCAAREQHLREAGFGDVFKVVKDNENELALKQFPGVIAKLDKAPSRGEKIDLAVRSVFAGNLFDLGAAATAQLHEAGQTGFENALAKLRPRPWVFDDLDVVVSKLMQTPTYHKALLFVDNAGSDILLGMLPFARVLLELGSKVVLAANSQPIINDITALELQDLLPRVAQLDTIMASAIADQRLTVIPNGSDMPMIDLRSVSEEVVEACEGVDLLVLEGMGRSIESNLHAFFTCDALNLGMVKHPEVAVLLGTDIYDCVCRFKSAQAKCTKSCPL